MKICTKCNATKQESEFYRASKGRSGLMSRCKECWKAQVIERRRTNPAVQEYERIRAKKPHRRAKAKAAIPRWRRAHPDLYRAQNAINNAIRDGKLTRGTCACGATKHVFGIAAVPSKPFDKIKWQCARCYHRGRFESEAA